MDELASFGSALRRWRKARDLSQAELAARSGCAADTIRKLEADARRPSRQLAERLAEQLALVADARRAFVQAGRGTLAADRLDLPPLPATSEVAQEALPGGTMTFLFSDIEGSTPLWEQHKEAMPQALARHDAILRQAVACQHGTIFKTVGDGVHAVFARAADALAAALSAQRALLAEAWEASGLPAGQPLRVRMALHTCAAEAREGDYYGPPINRLARLLAAAHGSQILLSRASAELLADGLPQGVSVRDLGTHQLTGLGRPEQIFQLVGPGLPAEFPPLRSVAPSSTNRPAPAMALLTTKLYVPPARPNLVARPRLLERVQAGLRGKLTLLAAPAGFGKSTLLCQACGAPGAELGELPARPSRQPPSAWVSLDAGDNDPTRFWNYVCAALDALLPGVAGTVLALLQSAQPPPIETLLPSLLNEVSARATDCVLVLDDYHVIDAAAIHDALAFLLDHLSPTLHLVIASRTDPPLPLSRLRARGELTELRAAELRFTPEEAATFLTQVMDLPLTPEEVVALETRTEGWIAGLQLAALAMRERHDRAGFIRAFTGSNRFVVDYLADEVFARQPPHIQTFLLQTSILDRMCGPLCDALLLGGAGGTTAEAPHDVAPTDSFSQVLLEQLERANVFVVPLDDERRWYRYHHLFGEMLRERLLRGAGQAAIATLHQRASAWYEQSGLIDEAIRHALAAPDLEAAAALVERYATPLWLKRGEMLLVRSWVNQFPDALIAARPRLTLAAGWTLTFSYQPDAVEQLLANADATLSAPDLPADVIGELTLLRSFIPHERGDFAETLALAQRALEQLPADKQTWRAAAALNSGHAYARRGETAAAIQALREASTLAAAEGSHWVALGALEELATLQARQGQLSQSLHTCERAVDLVSGRGQRPNLGAGMASVGIGEVLCERNDLHGATQALMHGIELLRQTTEGGVLVRGYAALARVQQARGDGASALATIGHAEEWFAQMQLPGSRYLAWLAAERARLWLRQGNLIAAEQWAPAPAAAGGRYLEVVQQLTLVRLLLARHQRDPDGPLIEQAAETLAQLRVAAEASGWIGDLIEILALQALTLQALGDDAGALAALEHALRLAEREGYVRIFVDEGTPMRRLLTDSSGQLAAQGRNRGGADAARLLAYVEALLAALPQAQSAERRAQNNATFAMRSALERSNALIEPLSERELEVLTLIAQGHSNQQIADALIVAVGTVKKHLNN
ncbi:MAG TPA: LuxR C-terminal-related transcriptional regulator, partial [Roseiflexaceae bacterium]